MGEILSAEHTYRQALKDRAVSNDIISNFLFCCNYNVSMSKDDVLNEHVRWGSVIDTRSHKVTVLPTERRMNDTLKIALLSPDFCDHAVMSFLLSLLGNFRRQHCEMYLYAEIVTSDILTETCRNVSTEWRETTGLSDAVVVQQIVADHIDIVIDLAGHTAGNRLGVVAAYPAPLTVSFLGYPHTTGMQSVDLRMVDSITDSPWIDSLAVEKLCYCDPCFLCFTPPQRSPRIQVKNDDNRVVFGVTNTLPKINEPMMVAWKEILDNVAHAELVIKNKSFTDETVRSLWVDKFQHVGITTDRLGLYGYCQSKYDHLDFYNTIDIVLDTFPYNGTTTTCEALWMGKPVVTLCGDEHRSRVGKSILHACGHEEGVCYSHNDYVHVAVAWARNMKKCRECALTMREKMLNSDLCNQFAYTQTFLSLLREQFHMKLNCQR